MIGKDFSGKQAAVANSWKCRRLGATAAATKKEIKAEKCSCRTSSGRMSHRAPDRFDERNAKIAEDAEKIGQRRRTLFSASSALSAFQIESMIGSTTHVFAGRRAQSFFCPQFFCLFSFLVRLGSLIAARDCCKISAFRVFKVWQGVFSAFHLRSLLHAVNRPRGDLELRACPFLKSSLSAGRMWAKARS